MYRHIVAGGYVTPCSTGLLEILSPDLKERISDVLILDPKRMVVGKLLVEGTVTSFRHNVTQHLFF